MAGKLKVIIFMGSMREGRMCQRVATCVKNGLAQKGIFDVETFDPEVMPFELLRKPLHFYGDSSAAPDWLKEANEKIKSCDGFIIISPEYNCTIPPALSNMMDHFPPASYKRKPTGIVSYSPSNIGGARAAVALRPFLAELGSPSIPSGIVIGNVSSAVTEDGKVVNETLQKRFLSFFEDCEWYMTALKNHQGCTTSL